MIGEIAARSRRRQRLAVLPVQVDGFLDDLAHLPLVISVAAAEDEPRGAADVALVLFGPFDDFHVSGTVLHVLESSNVIPAKAGIHATLRTYAARCRGC